MVAVIGRRRAQASIGLHQALGFSRIGVLPTIGFKFGGWIDIVLMQRALGGRRGRAASKSGGENG